MCLKYTNVGYTDDNKYCFTFDSTYLDFEHLSLKQAQIQKSFLTISPYRVLIVHLVLTKCNNK